MMIVKMKIMMIVLIMKMKKMTQVLDTVNLNHIVTREGGWDIAADWKVMMGTTTYFAYLVLANNNQQK